MIPITEKEMKETMFSIGDLKTPKEDGYGALFFKASWNTIKEDVIVVVQDFFINERMHKPLNNIIVNLVPKTSKAKHVKDYIHILCCSTMYKVISKIPTARLGMGIGSIVQGNQSTFIPGHHLHDHIMLAHELIRGYIRKGTTPRCMM